MSETDPTDEHQSRLLGVARALVPARLRPQLAGAVRSMQHRGTTVQCPCCGGSFDRFIPHRGRPYAKCPRCGSLERHRLLIGFLRRHTDLLVAEHSVLHVAPEYALQRQLRRLDNLDYRSADLDSPLAMDHVDLLDMPYGDESFDVVICNHVLEHVADDRRALREIGRVLRANGYAIVMSPIDTALDCTLEDPQISSPEERHRVFGQSDHLRRYGTDFARRVADEGFEVETVSYLDESDELQIGREGLRREGGAFAEDDIFVCRKVETARTLKREQQPADTVAGSPA
jgi:SAM-dependent methyltransferase